MPGRSPRRLKTLGNSFHAKDVNTVILTTIIQCPTLWYRQCSNASLNPPFTLSLSARHTQTPSFSRSSTQVQLIHPYTPTHYATPTFGLDPSLSSPFLFLLLSSPLSSFSHLVIYWLVSPIVNTFCCVDATTVEILRNLRRIHYEPLRTHRHFEAFPPWEFPARTGLTVFRMHKRIQIDGWTYRENNENAEDNTLDWKFVCKCVYILSI